MRLFALALVVGALVLQHQRALPDAPLAPLHAAAAFTLALVLVPRRHFLARAALLLAAGSLVGFGYAAWRGELRLAEALPVAWEGRDVPVSGVIAGLPQMGEKGTRFLFAVERWPPMLAAEAGHPLPSLVSLAWYAEDEAEEVTRPPPLEAGQRWQFTVRLKRPRGLANPHAFDFESWALERDIRAAGYVRTKAAPRLIDARVDGWPFTLHRLRGAIRERMLAHLGDARLRGVLVALAIGDQDAIDPADWDVFWRTGVGHLMSISGLHITMIGALGFAIAFFVWVRVPGLALRIPARKAAVVAGALTALAYTLVTGYAVPAQRTLVMLATVAVCVLAERHGSPSRVLAAAVLAVIAIDPWAVLSPGFWLSFGAVAAIFYVMSLRTGRPGKLHAALLEQLAVTVIMLPMLVALFGQVSLVSPLANAFAIPLVSLVVVPLTLGGAFLPLPLLLDAAHIVMTGVMLPLHALAALPLAMLETHEPAPWTIAAAVVGCLWLLAPRGIPMRACGLVWIAPLFAVTPPHPAAGEAWIDVLDVGNALATVVRTEHHALAFDTGPAWNADSDGGNRIVLPFLRGEGVGRLDGLVVSHADDDHAGGAASIALARDPPWLLSALPVDDPLLWLVADARRCLAGETWRWDGVDFVVLHPGEAAYAADKRRENDRSCVMKVSAAGGSLLLAADAETRAEREMLARDAPALRSDVVVIGHHGSRSSSTPAFVDAVAPAIGVLSVGYRNRFRHPSGIVVARYRAHGTSLRRTDDEGALRIVLPARAGGAPRVSGQQTECRYWSARASCNRDALTSVP